MAALDELTKFRFHIRIDNRILNVVYYPGFSTIMPLKLTAVKACAIMTGAYPMEDFAGTGRTLYYST
eukprot:scaffold15837_cov557-Ochromonas_danica.AAC.1